MAGGGRRRQRATLASFVAALEGSRVVVELRYDTIVRGQLLASDDQLNLQLSDASITPLQGQRRECTFLYLRGRHVRFIHLPANLDPAAAIEQHRKRVAQAVRQHAQQQAQAQQQPEGRLHKGAQLEFDRQQPGGSSGGGAGGSSSGAAADMDTD
jgi:small nuclear ribonucleoprotein (snRNP)-like protein